MNNGPLPTTLTFLSALPTHPTGIKVRFLGCVTHYRGQTATLELQHAYSPPSTPQKTGATTIALVDVNLLLENLKREDMIVGAWVNVLGYVEGIVKEGIKRGKTKAKGPEEGGSDGVVYVGVQAVMLWSAGG